MPSTSKPATTGATIFNSPLKTGAGAGAGGFGGVDHFGHVDIDVYHRSLLNKPLLWRRLDEIVQLQPRRGQLLRGWLVLALRPPLPASHDEEDQGADDGNEQHAAHDRAHDQGDVSSSP